MKRFFPLLILLSAISVSLSAAYYSIFGLSRLFSGAYWPVIVMATTLEISKLIIATALHSYWSSLSYIWKIYLIPALFVLMIITSAGIYGFLSNAYQITYSMDLKNTTQIELLNLKKQNFIDKKTDYTVEKNGVISSISQLRSGLSNNTQTYTDKNGHVTTTVSRDNRKAFESQLKDALDRRDLIDSKINTASDSIFSIELNINSIQNSSSVTSELGPLKYISKISGKSMDIVVNWLLLLIIGVFDPLAIILLLLSLKVKELNTIRVLPVVTNSDTVVEDIPAYSDIPQSTIEVDSDNSDIISEPLVESLDEPLDEPLEESLEDNNDIIKNSVTNVGTLSPILSDKLDKVIHTTDIIEPEVEPEKQPILSESQKKIMSHQEINEFYSKFRK